MESKLQEALNASRDMGNYPDVFPVDFGKDIVLKTKPELVVKIMEPRRVRIVINSYMGICGWAVHYYATIEADGIVFIDTKRDCMVGGYLGEEYKELCEKLGYTPNSPYRIEVVRSLKQEEIDKDSTRWEYYDAGDMVNAFYKAEDALKAAMDIAKVRFPGWQVQVEE